MSTVYCAAGNKEKAMHFNAVASFLAWGAMLVALVVGGALITYVIYSIARVSCSDCTKQNF